MSSSLSSRERDNPPPRRKACVACIKSKRRCDVGLPACQRCLHRQIECVYEPAVVPLRTDRPARQRRQHAAKRAGGVAAAPSCPAMTALENVADVLPWDDLPSLESPLIDLELFSAYTPSDILATASPADTLLATAEPLEFTMFQDADSLLDSLMMTPAPPAQKDIEIYRAPMQQPMQEFEKGTGKLQFDFPAYPTSQPGPPIPFHMTKIFRSRMKFAVEELRRAPRLFLETTGTPWMHPSLYRDHMPPAVEDAYSACALLAAKNAANEAVIMRSIDRRVAALAATPLPGEAPLSEVLARAQALILYQSMYLLDEKASQLSGRTVSAPAAVALEEVTYRLLDKVVEGLAEGQSSHAQCVAADATTTTWLSPPAGPAGDGGALETSAAPTVCLQSMVPHVSGTEHLPLYPLGPTRAFWERWTLHESTARTFLAAFFLVQLTRLLSGADPAPCTARTALWNHWTLAARLWHAAGPVEFAQAWNEAGGRLYVVSPSTIDGVLRDCGVDDVDTFGKMIFTTTLGLDEIRGWFASKGGVL
ncbi:hypothetical protein RB597_000128 [Gaeumannomyces tritici]